MILLTNENEDFITIENCDFDDELIFIAQILEDDLFSWFIRLHIHKEICTAVCFCVAHNSGFCSVCKVFTCVHWRKGRGRS